MNQLLEFLHSRFAQALGWTLVNSIWEIAAVAVLAAMVLWMGKRSSAGVRYAIACASLALMLAAPAATWFYVLKPVTLTTPGNKVPNAIVPVPGDPGSVLFVDRPARLAPPPTSIAPLPWSRRASGVIEPCLPAAVAIYVAGLALFFIRLGTGCWQLERLARTGTPVPEALVAPFEKLRRRLAIVKPVRLLESAQVQVPTLVGFLRPIIFLPASAFTGLSPDQLSAILAHELAHIRRHDYLVNLLQSAIEAILFYHPAVWWLSARIRQEREHCCDDLAIAVIKDPLNYARALASMESLRASPARVPAELALTARSGALLPRIRRILGFPPAPPNRRRPVLTFPSLLMALTLIAGTAIYLGCRQNSTAAQATQNQPAATAPSISNYANEAVEYRVRVLLVPDNFLDKLPKDAAPSISASAATSDTIGNEEDKNPGAPASEPRPIPGQLLDDAQASSLLKAASQNKKTVTLTAPRVVAFRGEHAQVSVTQQQPYIAGDAVTSPPTATQPQHALDIRTLNLGVTIDLTGSLSADRKTIDTNIHYKNAELRGIDTFSGAAGANAQTQSTVQVPHVHNTHIDTQAPIPAGQTLLLRGPSVATEVEQEKGTPGLSNLPGVGRLFTTHAYVQENFTLLLLLTAAPAADAHKSELLKDDAAPATQTSPASTGPAALGAVGRPMLEEPVDPTPLPNSSDIKTEVTLISVSPKLMDDFRIGYDLALTHGIGKIIPPNGTLTPQASIIDNWTLNLFLNATQKDPQGRTLAKSIIPTPPFRWVDVPISFPPAGATQPVTATQPSPILLRYRTTASIDMRHVIIALGPDSPPVQQQGLSAPLSKVSSQDVTSMAAVPDGGTLFINLGKTESPGDPKKSEILILLLRPNIQQDATRPSSESPAN